MDAHWCQVGSDGSVWTAFGPCRQHNLQETTDPQSPACPAVFSQAVRAGYEAMVGRTPFAVLNDDAMVTISRVFRVSSFAVG